MKKIFIIGALVLSLGVGSLVAFADTVDRPTIIPNNNRIEYNLEDRESRIKERIDYRKEKIKEDLESGIITNEEAKAWEEHYNSMEEFHRENGYMYGGGGCHGLGRGMRGHHGRYR